jgi:hypothetical protein
MVKMRGNFRDERTKSAVWQSSVFKDPIPFSVRPCSEFRKELSPKQFDMPQAGRKAASREETTVPSDGLITGNQMQGARWYAT